MSKENLAIVRRVFEAANRRDTNEVMDLYDTGVEWDLSRHPYAEMSRQKVYYGHEGLREWFREWYEAFENFEHDLEELIDADESVVSIATDRATGGGSGVDVTWKGIAGVWTIRDGRILPVVWFPTEAEALEAVGLSE